jgi:DNA-binding Xre family transcriptional regulator
MGISYKPLFKQLIDKGLKKTDLLEVIPISTTTLAKLSKNQPIDGKILEKLCEYFDCQPGDIIEYVKDARR